MLRVLYDGLPIGSAPRGPVQCRDGEGVGRGPLLETRAAVLPLLLGEAQLHWILNTHL